MSQNPISSKEGQTDVLIRKGVIGGSLEEISGGYGQIQGKFKSGTEIFEIKYVEPGATLGMKYSSFIFVNGHWKFFGKLYRAF